MKLSKGDLMTTRVLYFAYGSNMKTYRLHKRAPSARPAGRAKLLNKRLVCNKRGKDGSGKANLEDNPGHVVWGVLYEMDSSDLDELNKAEEGYYRKTVYVQTDQNKMVAAEVYISPELTLDAIPFDWYKKLLVCGALERQLPEEYVEFLKQLPSKSDPDRTRC